MHIFKITDTETGSYYIDSYFSEKFKPTNPKSLASDIMSRPTHTVELLGTEDKFRSSVPKYEYAIQEINKQDADYKLLNGRFRVNEHYKSKHLTFIYTVQNLVTGMYYISESVNPINKLYRLFVTGAGYKPLQRDIEEFGKDKFQVRIHGPFNDIDLSDKLYELVASVSNSNGTNLYNPTYFDKMKSYLGNK